MYCSVFKEVLLKQNGFRTKLESILVKYSMPLVSMRLWETPVPIPNTTVKTQAAENTMLETAWEDRWVPEFPKEITRKSL